MHSIKFKLIISILSLAILASCSSEPKVTEFINTADPQAEIERVERNINMAVKNQVDILSPKNFEASKESLSKAIKMRSQNKDQKNILHSIALSQAYLDKANSVTDVTHQLLSEAITARQDALTASAMTLYPKEMNTIDMQFRKITEQFENNDTSATETKKQLFVTQYRDLEIKSIKKQKLGNAQFTIEQSIKEGAKKLTPETLTWAQKEFAQSDAIIAANRHDVDQINKASLVADKASQRLIKMVRNAKNSTAKNPEDLAKLVEKNEIASATSKEQLNLAENSLIKSENKLDHADNLNQKLEAQAWLDKEFESARSKFTKEEAEVYKQGDTILLRLKGLSFANNKAVITSNNFPLLAKVQKVIGDIGSSQITVEGHTDSIGGKELNDELSSKRAESVQSYLIANKNIASDKIKAAGFGYSKPIATNKTAAGRAQNRRVDIIILAEPITE